MNRPTSVNGTPAPTLAQKYTAKKLKGADYLHSSGYAKAQSGDNIGSATTAATFKARQAIEDQRKYVQKYRNAKILQGIRAYDRAKTYVPRVEKTANLTPGRGSLTSKEPSSSPSSPSSTPSRRVSPISLQKS